MSAHHRVILVIETSARALSCLDVFKQKFVVPLNHQLACLASFEVALVTFGPVNGTARTVLSCSPWTEDLQVLNTWIDGLHSLAEGCGPVAAYEAIAEAWDMLNEAPERPRGPSGAVYLEAFVLWLSDARPLRQAMLRAPQGDAAQTPDDLVCQLLTEKRLALVVCTPHTALPYPNSPMSVVARAMQRCTQLGTAGKTDFVNTFISIFPCLRAASNVTAATSSTAVLTAMLSIVHKANQADPELMAQMKSLGQDRRRKAHPPPQAAAAASAASAAAAPPQQQQQHHAAPAPSPHHHPAQQQTVVRSVTPSQHAAPPGPANAGPVHAVHAGGDVAEVSREYVLWRGALSLSMSYPQTTERPISIDMSISVRQAPGDAPLDGSGLPKELKAFARQLPERKAAEILHSHAYAEAFGDTEATTMERLKSSASVIFVRMPLPVVTLAVLRYDAAKNRFVGGLVHKSKFHSNNAA